MATGREDAYPRRCKVSYRRVVIPTHRRDDFVFPSRDKNALSNLPTPNEIFLYLFKPAIILIVVQKDLHSPINNLSSLL